MNFTFRICGAVLFAALAACNQTLSDGPAPQQVSMDAFKGKKNTPLVDPGELRGLTVTEKRILHKSFARDLKDPESARFRWTQIAWKRGSDFVYYCATVNGKNSYGAYIGFKPFIGLVKIIDGKIVGGDLGAIGDNDPGKVVLSECRRHGLDPFASEDES